MLKSSSGYLRFVTNDGQLTGLHRVFPPLLIAIAPTLVSSIHTLFYTYIYLPYRADFGWCKHPARSGSFYPLLHGQNLFLL